MNKLNSDLEGFLTLWLMTRCLTSSSPPFLQSIFRLSQKQHSTSMETESYFSMGEFSSLLNYFLFMG